MGQKGHFEGFEILKGFNLRSGLYKRSNTPALKENFAFGLRKGFFFFSNKTLKGGA